MEGQKLPISHAAPSPQLETEYPLSTGRQPALATVHHHHPLAHEPCAAENASRLNPQQQKTLQQNDAASTTVIVTAPVPSLPPDVLPYLQRTHHDAGIRGISFTKLPATPAEALSNTNLARWLTRFERDEILQYRNIYYTGRDAAEAGTKIEATPDPSSNMGFDDVDGFLKVIRGDQFVYHWKIIEGLSRGTFGQVVEAQDMNPEMRGRRVAIKIFAQFSHNHDDARFEREKEILTLMQVQGSPDELSTVVQCFAQSSSVPFRKHYYLCFELLGKNLDTLLHEQHDRRGPPGFPPDVVQQWAVSLTSGLRFLGRLQITHHDLKLDNIVSYCDPLAAAGPTAISGVKIVDFGSAFLPRHRQSLNGQRFSYMAPDRILGCQAGPAGDAWSLGCILFELLTGERLFPMRHPDSVSLISPANQLYFYLETVGAPLFNIMAQAATFPSASRYFLPDGKPREEVLRLTADVVTVEQSGELAPPGQQRPRVPDVCRPAQPGNRSLAHRLGERHRDSAFAVYLRHLLSWDPNERVQVIKEGHYYLNGAGGHMYSCRSCENHVCCRGLPFLLRYCLLRL